MNGGTRRPTRRGSDDGSSYFCASVALNEERGRVWQKLGRVRSKSPVTNCASYWRPESIRFTSSLQSGVCMKHSKRQKPPGRSPAADGFSKMSRFYGIGALAVLALGGCHGQAHLLADRPRQEPAYRIRLPASGFHQFLRGGSAGSLQQFQDFGGLAAIPCGSALLFALGRFGRFLGGGGLLSPLCLLWRNVRAPLGSTGR